jgi:Zn-dependent M28 family amino/carboxypeptidase
LPALFLSYTLGEQLADAAQDPTTNLSVLINIAVNNDLPAPVGNICADTPTGDITQTIVIDSHSDSVPATPGINDNGKLQHGIFFYLFHILGSGSAANLGLAIALARLFQTSNYTEYKYRVWFCWWGAEEVGLLGSDDHVKKAKNSTVIGERLSDYLINLNYDMLGSPNYIFGIYDGRTANNATPSQALPGSNKITALFKGWFDQQNLPSDYTDFSGRSDYGPFLAEGIVAGGLFTGADGIKT